MVAGYCVTSKNILSRVSESDKIIIWLFYIVGGELMGNVESTEEVIIKSKKRVQNHGEVFTPKWIIEQMLNTAGVKEACENIESTFLEPSAGEGAFLVAILSRKLEMVTDCYNESLKQYEHYSLFALTTLYGVELLQDNAKICAMNLFETYLGYYNRACEKHKIKQRKSAVLNSAKNIISANIQQGNFLTRLTAEGEPLIFSEWKALSKLGTNKSIKVIRTEYTLDEIQHQMTKPFGETVKKMKIANPMQLDLFEIPKKEAIVVEEKILKYSHCLITDVYKKIMET